MPLNCNFAFASEVGSRRRNEDAVGGWAVSPSTIGFAVADGLGGLQGGQRASNLALLRFQEYLRSARPIPLEMLARNIHAEIRNLQEVSPADKAMATTFSAAVLDNSNLHIVHCGDSRIALQRGSGIRRLTRDQSEAQRLLDEGSLSPEEFDAYPRKNVLESALGIKRGLRVDTLTIPMESGDRLFLTTDGFHTKVLLREIKLISDASHTAEDFIASSMLQVSQRNPDDNYSIVAAFMS